MNLLGGVISVSGVAVLTLAIMVVAALGYLLGRVTIKGVSLGTAGVFIIALLFGALFYNNLAGSLKIGDSSYLSQALKIVENVGLVFFVTSVGFIAGPKFFKNLAKNFKSYILLGVIIILAGGISCIGCYYFGITLGGENDHKQFMAMLDGLLSGSLTSTPAFSAAKATVENMYAATPEVAEAYEAAVTVGHGIAYLFGVIGVVLFVQLIPKFVKADMEAERKKLSNADVGEKKAYTGKLIEIDGMGLGAFALAAIVGIIVGGIKIPLSGQGLSGTCFSLTTTGGTLITALVFGHFGHVGPINLMPSKKTLENLRELGLALFLIGAGIAGGASFIQYFKPVYFIYGIIMTIVPMIVGYLFAKYVLKLSLLNNLGSITGGMTSTPALGTLINVAKTDEVASAYAATYPIALLAVVLVSQFLLVIWG
ncbi:MAG: permease [Clostridia bacterium]|nr:permease [Clostridia bacterium]